MCITLNRHVSAVDSICVTQLQKTFSTCAAMADKFKLPARYGAGEKSVW